MVRLLLLLTALYLSSGSPYTSSPGSYEGFSIEDDMELANIQLNKDIEVIHVSVDLSALFSLSKWKIILSNIRNFLFHRNPDRLSTFEIIQQSKNDFLRLVKTEHLNSFMTRESLSQVPLVCYIDCSNDPSSQTFRKILSMSNIRRMLNNEFAFYVTNAEDVLNVSVLESLDGRVKSNQSILFALTCFNGIDIRLVFYSTDGIVSEESLLAFLRKIIFEKALKP